MSDIIDIDSVGVGLVDGQNEDPLVETACFLRKIKSLKSVRSRSEKVNFGDLARGIGMG
jgi:hypothetical protein